jgi:hypothetical protein
MHKVDNVLQKEFNFYATTRWKKLHRHSIISHHVNNYVKLYDCSDMKIYVKLFIELLSKIIISINAMHLKFI